MTARAGRLPRWPLASALVPVLAAMSGCGPEPSPRVDSVGTLRREIRPTDGTGWNGNGYGIPAKFHDPPGGHFRVYYVESGDQAVDLTDTAPKNGIPDFVEQVGLAAEATYKSTVTERGFRPPLDDSRYHDRPDYGGDGRFDIYLRWAGKGSDGYRVIEACTDGKDGSSADRCAGYFVMNPSYKGSHYPTELDGIQVLTSHELFHSLQDAYNVGQWRSVTEGTAVWNEIQVFPSSPGTWDDYLGFLPAFFNEPERPLDQSMGAGAAASWAYATAVWFEFLHERYGPTIIREIWEGCEGTPTGEAPHFLDATQAVLKSRYQTDLGRAYTEFTRWNLLTAARGSDGRGYKRAREYPAVKFLPTVTSLGVVRSADQYGLGARYFRFEPMLTRSEKLRLTVTDPESSPPVAAAFRLASGAQVPGLPVEVENGSVDVSLSPGDALLVVVTGAVRDSKARQVSARLDLAPPPVVMPMPMPPPTDEKPPTGSACAMSGATTPPPGSGFFLIGLGLAAVGATLRSRRRSW